MSLSQSRRKVEDDDDIETRPPRRSRHDLPDSRSAIVSRRVVETGSLYSIIRRDPRRAYVEPIGWTSYHLQSLGCSFNRQRLPGKGHDHDGARGEPDHKATRFLSPEHAARVKFQLAQVSTLTVKRYAVKEILEAYDIRPQGAEDLSFQFNRHNVARLPTDGIFTLSADISSSLIAFVTFDTIESLRESYIRPKRKLRNRPILNKTQNKLQLIQPPDQAEDPYLVALLIALAQTQRRQQYQSSIQLTSTATDDACHSLTAKVLAIPGTQSKYFYVYTATIPTEFLDKFEDPFRFTPSGPISISYYRIPVKEERSLERLYRLLHG
ncbi:hypothetical protein ASPBRDRAFT_68198 [Aspergillus brasiliensis CBS 101740]|uniref:Uncharacterized protein n=1 Tax=Aspergillus brasiliensis (strain CBS 101740 / IMI 381727 / IBT 21946) TaxID=767769 RepID=A0A1L9UAM4_ASPBC|nr:hypothetical protein ASPBRDRAFT_68198 [Aspergillus brasiliensis CBS 101740]